jgi:diguanylate cyclase (GGDEF)-like protein
VARSISNETPMNLGGRRRHDHADRAFGEDTPYRFLAGIYLVVGLGAAAFGLASPAGATLRTVDLMLAVLLFTGAAVLHRFGPRNRSGWLLDLALATGYALAALGLLAVPDGLGQLVIGYGFVIFGVFAGVFRPLERLIGHLALMLGLYAGAMALDPHLPNPLYVVVVAMTTIVVSGMVHVLAGRLREMALHDPLTGVLNRRGLELMSDLVAAQAARTETPVTVALVDLDKFKAFNDTKGHVAGDARLIEIAEAWEREVRSTDLVARFGGDEFAVVLPGATEASIHEVVGRVRARVSAPFSVGVAMWAPHEDLYVAIRRADSGLFADKVAPRDAAGPDDVPTT